MRIAALGANGSFMFTAEMSPIAVVLTQADKDAIAAMPADATVYACFSDQATKDERLRIAVWLGELKRGEAGPAPGDGR